MVCTVSTVHCNRKLCIVRIVKIVHIRYNVKVSKALPEHTQKDTQAGSVKIDPFFQLFSAKMKESHRTTKLHTMQGPIQVSDYSKK